MYSITEGFSPILSCRPDVSFSKNEEEAIPPGGKKYLGTVKASTRMILAEGVQNMYRRCTIYLEYYYSERECKGAGTCPCMEINVSVQYNGGLLPDIILSPRCVFFKK